MIWKNPYTKIILGSGSPRRKQLLAELGFEFVVEPANVEEIVPETIPAMQHAEYLAALKSKSFTIEDEELVITSDTTVVLDGKVLNKPQNRTEALNMLKSLEGETHFVVSGICLRDSLKMEVRSVVTEVTMKSIPSQELEYYVDEYKPMDKAGAYGIQEWIGMVGVETIQGSYYNVVGLPTAEFIEMYKNMIK